MKITFSRFQFDCESRLLIEDGEIISLSDKSTQLLLLFLSNGNKVHSKTDILDFVWPDRVVTDQVVFQNVSQLRMLFGSESIKTFSKKGYQWQIPVTKTEKLSAGSGAETITEPATEQVDIQIIPQLANVSAIPSICNTTDAKTKIKTSDNLRQRKKIPASNISILITLSVAIAMTCIVILFIVKPNFYFFTGNLNSPSKILLIPDSSSQMSKVNKDISSSLLSSNDVSVSHYNDINQLTPSVLFDSPFKTWREHSQSEEQLLLSYKLYPLQKNAFGETLLRFFVQGKQRGWQGDLIGRNVADVTTQLTQLLATIQLTSYFSLTSEKAALAQLILLQNGQSESSLLTLKLIKQYFELEDFDNANALFDDAILKVHHPIYIGLFHLIKTNIAMRNSNWLLAQQHINIAIEKFSMLKVAQLESKALIQASWTSLAFEPHTKSIEYLNLAANKARVANEAILELQTHVIQLYLAAKNNEPTLMYSHMDQARQLISLHRLNKEHEIMVYYYMAAGDSYLDKKKGVPNQELFYFQKILAKPFSKLYGRYFYEAAEFVREELIKQRYFEAAKASIKPWQRTSFADISRSKIANAQQNKELAINYAIQAFTSARVAHELYDSLDAALLIVKYNKNSKKTFNQEKYIDYISKNSTRRWQRINKSTLDELGHWLTLY